MTSGELPDAAPGTREALPVRRRQPARELVRTVACPTCDAPAGEHCRGRRGPRVSNHYARVELLVQLRYGARLELPRTGAKERPTAAAVKAPRTPAAASPRPTGGLDSQPIAGAMLAPGGSALPR